jgi:hypothetical protein
MRISYGLFPLLNYMPFRVRLKRIRTTDVDRNGRKILSGRAEFAPIGAGNAAEVRMRYGSFGMKVETRRQRVLFRKHFGLELSALLADSNSVAGWDQGGLNEINLRPIRAVSVEVPLSGLRIFVPSTNENHSFMVALITVDSSAIARR